MFESLRTAFSGVFIVRLVVGMIAAGVTAWGVSFFVADYVVRANTSSANQTFSALQSAIEANTERSNQNSAALQEAFASLVATINANTESSNSATDRLVRSLEQTDGSLKEAITDNTSAIRSLTDAADAQRVRVEELGRQVNRMERSIDQASFHPGMFPPTVDLKSPFIWTNYGAGGPMISAIDGSAAGKIGKALSEIGADAIRSYDFDELYIRQNDGTFRTLDEQFRQ